MLGLVEGGGGGHKHSKATHSVLSCRLQVTAEPEHPPPTHPDPGYICITLVISNCMGMVKHYHENAIS